MTTPTVDLPEAPASVNFNCVTSKGWKMQWTLRDWSEEALFERTVAFIKKLDEAHVVPLGHEYAPAPAPSLGSALPNELPVAGSPAPQKAEELSFEAETLVGSMDKGKRFWKIQGGRFSKFGVSIWPEVAAEAGIDLDSLDIATVYPLAGLTALYIEKEGKPSKVTRLVRR